MQLIQSLQNGTREKWWLLELPLSKWSWTITSITYHSRKENDFFQRTKTSILISSILFNRCCALSAVYMLGTLLSTYRIISFSFPNPEISFQIKSIFLGTNIYRKESRLKRINTDNGHVAIISGSYESLTHKFDWKHVPFPP